MTCARARQLCVRAPALTDDHHPVVFAKKGEELGAEREPGPRFAATIQHPACHNVVSSQGSCCHLERASTSPMIRSSRSARDCRPGN